MSFLKDIEKLAQPEFQLPDLEDEDVDGTSSRYISKTKYTEDDDMPKLRRKIIALDVDDSSKYGGTKVSRGDIFDDFSGMTGLSDHPTNENGHIGDDSDECNEGDDGEESDEDEDEANALAEAEGDDEEIDEHDEEHESGDEAVPTTSIDDEDKDEGSASESGRSDEEQEGVQLSGSEKAKSMTMQDLLKNVDRDKQQRKAESVRAQSEIWEQLLYVKIKLHAALTAFNQLPRGQLAKTLLKEADEETVNNLKLAQKNALKLVSSLLEAESVLLASSSFTKLISGGDEGMVDSDDEEIESSEDEEDKDDDSDFSEEEREEGDYSGSGASHTLPLNVKSLSKRLCESEEHFTKFRNSTLIKWDERTKLISSRRPKDANTDFSAFEKENIVTQIEKICADKPRVLKRCRTKKSDVERIGGNVEAEEDEEIFDDDDFYQVLLKELIDKKTSNTLDPVAMTRHYIEMQKLKSRRSKKKYVDHRASKDRKIKYLPIPKLVNFHPAMPEMIEWSHESRNELFKSLFS